MEIRRCIRVDILPVVTSPIIMKIRMLLRCVICCRRTSKFWLTRNFFSCFQLSDICDVYQMHFCRSKVWKQQDKRPELAGKLKKIYILTFLLQSINSFLAALEWIGCGSQSSALISVKNCGNIFNPKAGQKCLYSEILNYKQGKGNVYWDILKLPSLIFP